MELVNDKKSYLLDSAINRDSYTVFQDNEMAKSFGKLSRFEHKMLDYCTSFIQGDSLPTDMFAFSYLEVLKYLGLASNGGNYTKIKKTLSDLKTKSNLWLPLYERDSDNNIILDDKGRRKKIGMIHTSTIESIYYYDSGLIGIKFSSDVYPFLFELKRDFYSLSMRELSMIKGKHARILAKLWQAKSRKNRKVARLEGSAENWQTWFLGDTKRLEPSVFKRDVLKVASKELEKLFQVKIELNVQKNGRDTLGYHMTIIDNREETEE